LAQEEGFLARTPSHYAALSHYFIGCHDAPSEFLARNMKIELTSEGYGKANREAPQRAAGLSPNGNKPECWHHPACRRLLKFRQQLRVN